MESSDTSQSNFQLNPLSSSGKGAKSLPVLSSDPGAGLSALNGERIPLRNWVIEGPSLIASIVQGIKDQPLPLRLRLYLGWGKIRRFYLVHFRPRYVQASLERRQGDCHRTGACCNLMFSCPLLKNSISSPVCSIYERRPLTCNTFPIDERDLADRDLLMPDHPCGFSFRSDTSRTEVSATKTQRH